MKEEKVYIDFIVKFKVKKKKPIKIKVGNVSKGTFKHFFGSITRINKKLTEEDNVPESELRKILLRKR